MSVDIVVINAGGDIRCHRDGCRDIDRDLKRHRGSSTWTVLNVTHRKELVINVYAPYDFDYEPDEWKEFDDLNVLACVGTLPETDSEDIR